MQRNVLIFGILGLVFIMAAATAASNGGSAAKNAASYQLSLPEPNMNNSIPLDKALMERRSVRAMKGEAMTMEDVSDLLWAAQGITDDQGHRTAGSAFEAYPLEIYLMAGNVTDVPSGLYRYLPQNQTLLRITSGDLRQAFVNSSVVPANAWIKGAPAIFVITGVFDRAAKKGVGKDYVYVEAGLASQNFALEATSLDLGNIYIGGFDANSTAKFLGLQEGELPIAVLPVGKKA